MIRPGTLLGGKYELVSIAGTGGMATVWRALQRGPAGFERTVGLKLMREDTASSQEYLRMFVEEARVASQLSHPNIVQIYDFGSDDGRYFLVMEWVEGLTLADYLHTMHDRGVLPPWPLTAGIALEVLGALAAAHERVDEAGVAAPVFHRDVTPQNMLIGRGGKVKLADFGLARATDRARMTDPYTVKGKLAYLAPELTRGMPASARTDLFSLGIVLWQALAGRRLFHGKDDIETFVAVSRAEVPPLSETRPDVPAEFLSIVERALATDPSDRFESAQQMSRVLAKLIRTSEVSCDARVIAESLQAVVAAREEDG
ncbi:MAG: serine/threonine protein kinase [Myxococcales bacterium]|nr:serine/threonine protein kinase [Myxococcales bacterium]